MRAFGGVVLVLAGLALVAFGVWRAGVGLFAPNASLWRKSPPVSYAEESLQLLQQHNARVQVLDARDAPLREYQDELTRARTASDDLQQRWENENNADAPQRRRYEIAVAVLCLLLGLFTVGDGGKRIFGSRASSEGPATGADQTAQSG